MRRAEVWWLMVLAFWVLPAGPILAADPKNLSEEIQIQLEKTLVGQNTSGAWCMLGETLYAPPLLAKFYAARNYQPFWSDDQGLLPKAEAFIQILENAPAEGLWTDDYHAKKISRLFSGLDRVKLPATDSTLRAAANLDILLSDAFFAYGTHLAVGRTSLEVRDGGFYDSRRAVKLADQLVAALSQDQVMDFLDSWTRTDSIYTGLKAALQHYFELAARQDWPVIPAGPELNAQEQDPARIPLVRKKLKALGDLPENAPDHDPVLDDALQAAIRQFQTRYGFLPDGRLTREVVDQLNQPLEKTILQLELNLERCRWLPPDLGAKYVLVNIPDFQLRIRENNRTLQRMKVVVGKQYRNTPVLASKFVYLVLDPTWTIPTQIIVEEKLSEILEEPDFFSRNHIEVIKGWGENSQVIDPATVDWSQVKRPDYYDLYRFRQEPGPWNSLGRIKFILPNSYDVYLHDTPDKELFEKPVRDFSHGCIRVEKPFTLAEYLLNDRRTWSRERLAKAARKNREQTLDLPQPIGVYINYLTALPEDDGRVYFFPDIYGRDQELALAWSQPLLKTCTSENSAQIPIAGKSE